MSDARSAGELAAVRVLSQLYQLASARARTHRGAILANDP